MVASLIFGTGSFVSILFGIKCILNHIYMSRELPVRSGFSSVFFSTLNLLLQKYVLDSSTNLSYLETKQMTPGHSLMIMIMWMTITES